jgi:hypothetical protein
MANNNDGPIKRGPRNVFALRYNMNRHQYVDKQQWQAGCFVVEPLPYATFPAHIEDIRMSVLMCVDHPTARYLRDNIEVVEQSDKAIRKMMDVRNG